MELIYNGPFRHVDIGGQIVEAGVPTEVPDDEKARKLVEQGWSRNDKPKPKPMKPAPEGDESA